MITSHNLPTGQSIKLIHDDLTKAEVDAIVNAANATLSHGGGVAGAIRRAGGEGIQSESDQWVREQGPVAHDRPAVTSAGNLKARYVIHAVGPRWGTGDEEHKLHQAVTGALQLAAEMNLTSIALPAISTGIFGFPKALGAQVILDAITQFFDQHPASSLNDVRLTLIDRESVEIFATEFARRWPSER
jgi:O-acetyl-ADP-ribose deacetylase (regulator of RNase III)